MKWYLYAIILFIPLTSPAGDFDDTDELYVTNAKTFIKQFPIIEDKLDETGLVGLWQRITGLQNLVMVWDTNRAAFDREGPDELEERQINHRIWSHKVFAKYDGNDELVKALVDIIRLHAQLAERYMNDEISYAAYTDVTAFATVSGRYFAKRIWIKYGKCQRNKSMDDKSKDKKTIDGKLLM